MKGRMSRPYSNLSSHAATAKADGVTRLAVAVVHRAVMDWRRMGYCAYRLNSYQLWRMRKFFFSKEFEMWCDAAGLEAGCVRKAVGVNGCETDNRMGMEGEG